MAGTPTPKSSASAFWVSQAVRQGVSTDLPASVTQGRS